MPSLEPLENVSCFRPWLQTPSNEVAWAWAPPVLFSSGFLPITKLYLGLCFLPRGDIHARILCSSDSRYRWQWPVHDAHWRDINLFAWLYCGDLPSTWWQSRSPHTVCMCEHTFQVVMTDLTLFVQSWHCLHKSCVFAHFWPVRSLVIMPTDKMEFTSCWKIPWLQRCAALTWKCQPFNMVFLLPEQKRVNGLLNIVPTSQNQGQNSCWVDRTAGEQWSPRCQVSCWDLQNNDWSHAYSLGKLRAKCLSMCVSFRSGH